MKILLISNMYPSKNHSYYGSFVKTFEDNLTTLGCDFSNKVIMTKTNYLTLRFFKYIIFYLQIIIKTFFGKYDLIYVHYVKQSALPFFLIKKYIRKPIIFNAHGSDLFSEKEDSLLLRVAYKGLKYCNKLVVPSNFLKTQLIKKKYLSQDKILVSPSGGINLKIFQYNYMPQEVFTLGYLGRIDEGKGIDTLMDAIYKLKNEKIKLIIGGGGSQKIKYEKWVKNNELDKNVSFLGFIKHEEVPKFHKQIDVFIFPSRIRFESLGLAPIEALACGVPVIANKNGAIEDYIIDGKNGLIYDNDDANQLANLILKLYKTTLKERLQMSKNARLIGERYDSKLIAYEMYKNLKQIL